MHHSSKQLGSLGSNNSTPLKPPAFHLRKSNLPSSSRSNVGPTMPVGRQEARQARHQALLGDRLLRIRSVTPVTGPVRPKRIGRSGFYHHPLLRGWLDVV